MVEMGELVARKQPDIMAEMQALPAILMLIAIQRMSNGGTSIQDERGMRLAIQIAEAVKANPTGFANWYKMTMGVDL